MNTLARLKLSLFVNYFCFAILLNSVGIAILKVITEYNIPESQAGILEGYKDLSIAIVSFFIASIIPKMGYRKSMLAGLLLVATISFLIPTLNEFWAIKLLFATIGISFALIKVSTYSTVGLIVGNSNHYASFLSILEGVFMLGVLSGYWLFGWFIRAEEFSNFTWLHTYWVIGGLVLISFFILLFTQFDETGVNDPEENLISSFTSMLGLIKSPLMIIFIVMVFLYVFIEQGVATWLPTFNNQVLNIPEAMSVELVSLFAAFIAIGRLVNGVILKYVNWSKLFVVGLILSALIIFFSLNQLLQHQTTDITSWRDVPMAAYLFPVIGFFVGPMYPILCSSILSGFKQHLRSAITGHIVVFSALGGTIGSLITGRIFGQAGGITALMAMLVPIILLIILMLPYKKLQQSYSRSN